MQFSLYALYVFVDETTIGIVEHFDVALNDLIVSRQQQSSNPLESSNISFGCSEIASSKPSLWQGV